MPPSERRCSAASSPKKLPTQPCFSVAPWRRRSPAKCCTSIAATASWACESFQLVLNKSPVVDFVRDEVEEHAADGLVGLTVQAALLQHSFRVGFQECDGGGVGFVERLAERVQVGGRFRRAPFGRQRAGSLANPG